MSKEKNLPRKLTCEYPGKWFHKCRACEDFDDCDYFQKISKKKTKKKGEPMKTNLFILIFILVIFWACESPMTPEIEEIFEEKIIEKPQAVITLSISPNPIHFQSQRGYFTLTLKSFDPPKISSTVKSVYITINLEPGFASPSYSSERIIYGDYYIDVGDRIIPADGELKIYCNLWIPYTSEPKSVSISIRMRDFNGNEISIREKIWATGIG